MRFGKYLFILLLIFLSNTSQAVIIEGREWRQVTDTVGLSWNQVSTVCSSISGVCNGNINSVNFDSWKWASIYDVHNLFAYYDPTPIFLDLANWGEVDTTWAPIFLTNFNKTEFREDFDNLYVVSGLTRSIRESMFRENSAYFAQLGDRTTELSYDFRFTRITYPLDASDQTFGHWLYRDVIQVPEPATYLLMSLGFIGLVITRRAAI
jgi:hypothetical protein